eukprot:scaffold84758_cov61-Attheya_sp.AAC.2
MLPSNTRAVEQRITRFDIAGFCTRESQDTSTSMPYIEVTYELLYNRDDPKEWRQILEFLGVGPSKISVDKT